jgi:hypothetical protein
MAGSVKPIQVLFCCSKALRWHFCSFLKSKGCHQGYQGPPGAA